MVSSNYFYIIKIICLHIRFSVIWGLVLFCFVWFSLVWFYGISTIVGYLMPYPFLYIQIVLFQMIQFHISILFISIQPIDRTLSGAATLGQSGPGSITEASPFRLFSVIYGKSYSSAKKQPVYSAVPATGSSVTLIIIFSKQL